VTTEKKISSATSRFFFHVLWIHVHGGKGNSKAVLDHAMKEERGSWGIAPPTLNLALGGGHYHHILTDPLYSSAYQLALRWNVRKQCARQLSQEEGVKKKNPEYSIQATFRKTLPVLWIHYSHPRRRKVPYILESNPHTFYKFQRAKKIRCGLESRAD